MVVWFASGLSLTRWIPTVLTCGLPVVLVIALLSFYATPWANRSSSEFRDRFEKRADIAKVAPGKFQESASSNRVFFVEGIAGDAMNVRNVFVNTVRDGKNSIVISKEGRTEVDANGDKFLVLSKGRRYEGALDENDFQLMEFESYGVLISNAMPSVMADLSSRSLSTAALLASPNGFNQGELLWRVSLPLMCLFLMLLAIPLGFVNPRGGRSANLIIALLLFVFYSNMVSLMQAAVVQNRLSIWLAWWPVHVLAMSITVLLFSWRLKMNSAYHPLFWLAKLRRKYFGKRSAT
jgi:lipopolysaccharide export system permease protein